MTNDECIHSSLVIQTFVTIARLARQRYRFTFPGRLNLSLRYRKS